MVRGLTSRRGLRRELPAIEVLIAGALCLAAVASGVDLIDGLTHASSIGVLTGAGSLFAVHVTSNTFWLLQSLMGQSTRGTLKTCSVGVSVASVVAILLIQPLALIV